MFNYQILKFSSCILLWLTISACEDNSIVPAFNSAENKPGGETTVHIGARAKFDSPAQNLAKDLKPMFYAGKALANQPWVKAPTITTARDGLGPIYNARSCLACHINGGKGFIPENNLHPLTGTLIRLSKKGPLHTQEQKQAGVIPHSVYGDQIQSQSISLAHQLKSSQPHLKHDVPPEAYIHVDWVFKTFTYPDGNTVTLREPKLDFKYLGYGPLNDKNTEETLIGIRVAPSIHGMGLIELIKQSDIEALADEHDEDQNNISGRVNLVWDAQSQSMLAGRFGLKANKATLAHTVAGAFTNDMGITTSLVPNQPCTSLQAQCINSPNGNDENDQGQHGKNNIEVELPDSLLKLVVDFNRNLAPIERRNTNDRNTKKGRSAFYEVGCHNCHQPSFITGNSSEFPHLSNQHIWPYSDFLLHDLGSNLSDNRPDFLASGSEWRTPPLWGIGASQQVNGSTALLHDGRANTVEEAILWHGGEAQHVQQNFINLPKHKRKQLINFVNSL